MELCAWISTSGVVILPHSSPIVLCTGHNITVGLHTLLRCMVKAGIQVSYLVGYGMKAPFEEMNTLVGLSPPPFGTVLCRYDLGRNIKAPYIPLFGSAEGVRGTLYPILHDFGKGLGSIEVTMSSPDNDVQSCKMQVYPHLIHYLKARGLGIEMPATVRRIV